MERLERARALLAPLGLALALASPSPAASDNRLGTGPSPLVVSRDGPYRGIAEALEAASPGDLIVVRGGIHRGPLVVKKTVFLVGEGWPVIQGPGRGSVLSIQAPGVLVRGFVVRGSGNTLAEMDAGIEVDSPGVRVVGNRLEDVLFGISLSRADGSAVEGNSIAGKDLEEPLRGDAIRVWESRAVLIRGNRIEGARDVVLWYSRDIAFRENTVRAGRYGLHFMYCDGGLVEGNVFSGNSVGAYLMYSTGVRVRRNVFAWNRGPSGYGLGLKDMDEFVVEENLFLDNRVGIFLDASPRQLLAPGRFLANFLAFNDTGIYLLPSVGAERLGGNAFLDNGDQVRIEGGSLAQADWSPQGRGNFWSDYRGFDADGDGRGDIPYLQQKLFEEVASRDPSLRFFSFTPLPSALDLASRAFPVIRPEPEVRDVAPLMRPPPIPPVPTPERPGRLAPFIISLLLLGAGIRLLGLGFTGLRAGVPRERGARKEEPLAPGRGM